MNATIKIFATIWLTGLLFLTSQAQTPRTPAQSRVLPTTYPTTPPFPDPLTWTSKTEVVAIKHSMEGQIVRVSTADRKLVIEEVKSKKFYNILLHGDTKLKADKHTELAGLDKLSVSDFKPGHRVKITYAGLGPKVLTVRLLKKK